MLEMLEAATHPSETSSVAATGSRDQTDHVPALFEAMNSLLSASFDAVILLDESLRVVRSSPQLDDAFACKMQGLRLSHALPEGEAGRIECGRLDAHILAAIDSRRRDAQRLTVKFRELEAEVVTAWTGWIGLGVVLCGFNWVRLGESCTSSPIGDGAGLATHMQLHLVKWCTAARRRLRLILTPESPEAEELIDALRDFLLQAASQYDGRQEFETAQVLRLAGGHDEDEAVPGVSIANAMEDLLNKIVGSCGSVDNLAGWTRDGDGLPGEHLSFNHAWNLAEMLGTTLEGWCGSTALLSSAEPFDGMSGCASTACSGSESADSA